MERRTDGHHAPGKVVTVDERVLDGLLVLAGEPAFDDDAHPFVRGDELAGWCGQILGAQRVIVLRGDASDELHSLPLEILLPGSDAVRQLHDGRHHLRLHLASAHHELTVVFSNDPGGAPFDTTLTELLVERLRGMALRCDHLEALAASSRVDPLTGLGNRAVADRAIARLVAGDGLIVLDLDEFKTLNDSRGHAVGDRVLRKLGRMLNDEVRASDVVARYGGDEVVVLLRAGGDLIALGDRLVREWSRRGDGTTISAGLAVCQRGEHPRSVFIRADDALYRAKRRGRDRLEVG